MTASRAPASCTPAHATLGGGRAGLLAGLGLAVLMAGSGARADKPPPLSPQTLTLPNGPTALKGLGESFAPNVAQGGGSYAVPLQLPPGILAPKLALAYHSGTGRTEIGVGFSLPALHIYRTTDKGLPDFDENDRFAVRGAELNDELVLVDAAARTYRLKNEGAFALFVRDIRGDRWTVELPSGERLLLGTSSDSRQANGRGTCRWLIARHEDRFGHAVTYRYLAHLGHRYLAEIRYQLHAPVEMQNQIVFSYESRFDWHTDYTYGETDTTALRLRTVEAFHGPRLLRTYRLEYEERDLFSLLAAVTLEGEHGERMPTLRLGYYEAAGPAMVLMTRTPPLEGLLSGQATLEDTNGDALPDVLYGAAGDYRYYENIDGQLWAGDPVVVGGSPDRNLADEDVLLADANGDGFRDVVYAHDDYFRVYPAAEIAGGVFSGYGTSFDLQTPGPLGFHWASLGVQPVDLNRDGRTDLLVQGAGQPYQVLNGKDNRLSFAYVPPLPADADLTQPNVQLSDFNGDGHLDLVRQEIAADGSRVRVWFGLGYGRYTGEARMANVPAGLREEFFLVDVNRDGQTDLLRVSGSQVSYQLNNGRLAFTAAQRVFDGAPSSGDTLRILMADMNGNGTSDVVWITRDYKLRYLDLLARPFAGLLNRIDNGMGGVTSITYRTSTAYMIEDKRAGQPWKSPMAAPMPVVAEMSTTDSLDALGLAASSTRTLYRYRDGYYDGGEREFRGFAQVTITEVGDARHPTQVTEISMHVGRNLKTGEDEEILKGRRHRELVRTASGLLVRSSEQRWERRWLCQEDLQGGSRRILPTCAAFPDKGRSKDSLVALAVVAATLEGAWEGTTSPRYTYVELAYDAFGNQSRKDAYGEVVFALPRQVGEPFFRADMDVAFGNDEALTTTTYINNPDEWLVGLVQSTELASRTGEVLRAGRTYYDGPDFAGLPLGTALFGKVKRREAWLEEAGGGRWISTELVAHDAHGQPVVKLDALGNRRELGYDLETGTFPTEERIPVEAGTLVFELGHDRGLGVVTDAIDFNGHRTRYLYDGLGRLETIIDPLGSEAEPLARFAYQFGTPEEPVSVTVVDELAARGAGTFHRRWLYADGWGRQRLVKAQAEAPFGLVASGFTELSARGGEVATYRPFASAVVGFEAPPTNTPVTRTELDVLGRPVRVFPPATEEGLTHTFTQYLPFEIRVYDERDTSEGIYSYPAVSRVDGLGRPVEVVKHNDYDDVFTELVWRAGYNAAGEIEAITDPAGHARTYLYDTLGRLTFIDDPNAGTIDLIYDDAGNLLSRVDALGQEVASTYGAANRLKARDVRGDVLGEPDYRYVFHYDAAGAELPEARNLSGSLAWVEGPVGNVAWSYDERGKTETTLQTLRDPEGPELPPSAYREDLTYDPQGRLLSVSLPGGMQVTYAYGPRGLVTELAATRGGGRNYGVHQFFDASGALARRDFANGQTTCLWRDDRGRVRETRTAVLGPQPCGEPGTPLPSAIQHLAYDLQPEGMLAAISDLSPARSAVPRLNAVFGYDRLYELTSAAWPEGGIAYGYDRIQNLVRRTVQIPFSGLPSGNLDYGEGAGPNAVTSAFGERYRYDAAGRMQSYGGAALRFDAEGRLAGATSAGSSLSWQYDFNGDRRLKLSEEAGGTTRQYRYPLNGYEERAGAPSWVLWAGSQRIGEVAELQKPIPGLYLLDHLVLAEHDATVPQPLPAELWDHDLAAAAQRFWSEQSSGPAVEVVRYYHSDQLGGPTHVTDAAGALVSLSRWYPYGSSWTELGWQPTRTFTGAEREAELDLGLMQMGARWYAPGLGRWVSPDLFYALDPRKGIASVLELNLYGYAGNAPSSFVDPSGNAATPASDPRINLSLALDPVLLDVMVLSNNFSPAAFERALQEGRFDNLNVGAGNILRGLAGEAVFAERALANLTLPVLSPDTLLGADLGELFPDMLVLATPSHQMNGVVVSPSGSKANLVRKPGWLGALYEIKSGFNKSSVPKGVQQTIKNAELINSNWTTRSKFLAIMVIDEGVWMELSPESRAKIFGELNRVGAYVYPMPLLAEDADARARRAVDRARAATGQ